jgi:hypothetical protein
MEHANATLLRRAWAAYDKGDVEGFAACLTDDWREYGPGGEDDGFHTLDDERPTMDAHRIAFPDKHTEIRVIVADNDVVACHCTVTATHTGQLWGHKTPIMPRRERSGDEVRRGPARSRPCLSARPRVGRLVAPAPACDAGAPRCSTSRTHGARAGRDAR